jgi:hypothetical protein
MAEPGTDISLPKDGELWRVGGQDEVEWIVRGTTIGLTITSGVPPEFDAYATVLVPDDHGKRDRQDEALLRVLRAQSDDPWWLGYLETGADDVVFPEAERVMLFAGWRYVLVQAGCDQAASWRSNDGRAWRGALPDLLFPLDRSWLVSYLWDDDWRCLGGSRDLVDAVLAEPALRAREVALGEDATPPGSTAR